MMKKGKDLIYFIIMDVCILIALVLCYFIGHNIGYASGFKEGLSHGPPLSGIPVYDKPYDRPDSVIYSPAQLDR